MVLAMSRPTEHPKTGVYQFRAAVPVELRPLLGKAEVERKGRFIPGVGAGGVAAPPIEVISASAV